MKSLYLIALVTAGAAAHKLHHQAAAKVRAIDDDID
jgi:hypothetical protein